MTQNRASNRAFSITNLASIRVFVSVVETGNFSTTAKLLNLSPSSVSKQIKSLEERLETRLVSRTTRKVTITEPGQQFYSRCVQMLKQLEVAEEEIHDFMRGLHGKLKIAAPTVLFNRLLAKKLPEFLQDNSDLQFELMLGSELVDLIDNGVDVAIRLGPDVPNWRMNAERLVPNRRVFCASPEYLKNAGRPKRPEDLADHNCLQGSGRSTTQRWVFSVDGETVEVPTNGSFMTNNGEVLLEAVAAGLGIGMLPAYLARESLENGSIVEVLQKYAFVNSWFYAVTPQTTHMPLRVERFVAFISEKLKEVLE